MNEENKWNYAIYARLMDSASEESVESQIETCLADARKRGFSVPDDHIFRDESVTKTFGNRPGMKRLLDAALSETHPIDIVVVDKNSRFSRKSHEMLSIYSALSRAGVKVRVVIRDPTRQWPKST